MTKAMLIAAPMSGSGKTSLCRGLVAALAQGAAGRALRVQTFKMGPDYLDPLHLKAASGRVCHNLDPWMMGEAACCELFKRNIAPGPAQPHVAIVEGAMGLFDGGNPASNAGSSADLAKILGIPVVLVVDVARQARSAAALVKGFLNFDPELPIAGVIFNRVGSPSHADLVRAALAEALPQVPVFGCLPTQEGLDLPGRHLGLQPPGQEAGDKTRALAAWVAAHVDFAALLAALPTVAVLPQLPGRTGRTVDGAQAEAQAGGQAKAPTKGQAKVHAGPRAEARAQTRVRAGRARIAVSRDAALFFLYQENLDLLAAAGAELAFFSPLADGALPADCSGLYLCGGYPELYARELSANQAMLESVRGFIGRGGPVYAECGGYMYLLAKLIDAAGDAWPLVGHFPWSCRMQTRRQALGYRELRTLVPSCLGPAGLLARGHEFHYSVADEPEMSVDAPGGAAAKAPARLFMAGNAAADLNLPLGVRQGAVAASYAHVHFASNPAVAHNFVDACALFGAAHELV